MLQNEAKSWDKTILKSDLLHETYYTIINLERWLYYLYLFDNPIMEKGYFITLKLLGTEQKKNLRHKNTI